jgi:hypothetical protein
MKSRKPVFARTFLAALAAVIALAGGANAQTRYVGKFTLPFAAHWAKVALPAGDYTFQVSSASLHSLLTIVDARGVAVGLTTPIAMDETREVAGQDCLVLERNADGELFVRDLRLASAGVIISYMPYGRRAKRVEEGQLLRINLTHPAEQSPSAK